MYYRFVSRIYKRAALKMCKTCQPFIKEGSKILDLGCGSAIVAKKFQEFFKGEILGIDISDKRVEKIPFKVYDGKDIPFPENCFDVTLISFVLHHVEDKKNLLKEAKRVTSGKIIIYEDLPEGFFSKLRCKIHGASFDKIFKNPDKTSFKTEKEWEDIFKELGLNIFFKEKVNNFPVKKELFVLVH